MFFIGKYPWQAVLLGPGDGIIYHITFQESDLKEKKRKEQFLLYVIPIDFLVFQGSGVLIDSRNVLTAAHKVANYR